MPHETQNMYRILRRHYHQHICRMHFISSPRPGCKLRNLSKNLHGQPTSRKPFFIGLRCPDSALRLSLAPGDFADCILKACSCAADNMLAFILLTYSLAVEKLRAMLGGADYYDDVNSFRYIKLRRNDVRLAQWWWWWSHHSLAHTRWWHTYL